MNVSALEWGITLGVTIAILLIDILVIARRPHEPSTRETSLALSFYIGLAVLFGLFVWWRHGQDRGIEFFAGWLTEYSLSIDNLFIFIIIMASFGVPRKYQQEALLVGIILALVFRGIFIAVGAAAIENLSWVFYVFGAFLVYTAAKLAFGGDDDEGADNAVVRFARRRFRLSDEWRGLTLVVREDGKRAITPMALVIVALGTTDVMFALDSIPAIFGLTREPYLVFTANVFALMGLRQLYFLIGGLLQRLVFLSYGLAFLLFFIGTKLVLEALHENELPFINGGEPVPVPVIPTLTSLAFIVVTLAVTAAVSLWYSSRHERSSASAQD
ncbi:tellurium resistance protein TerC [Aeromicrobium sp. PE09-221]|uniref:TerC family protein n=1 Tax=Aeromicrobium sp. PE09-221 TaxID=1898043 RepID=UPI000B3E65F3|nr:TerC family protein [Aeromicrobium sp. PE09-221]OUZ08342.1 tellurium resistance protein TerC [Aeromicrobium sp. PE09-221]